jgi:alpha-glucosidase
MSSTSSKSDGELCWWNNALIYQVYPRSFADSEDSNNEGIGDLRGLTRRLKYIQELGVKAIWLPPVCKTPKKSKDGGYDIKKYDEIDDMFGNMENFDEFVKEAHRLGLKVISDQVWSHTSDEHYWFNASVNYDDPDHPAYAKYKDYYVWVKGNPNEPPNNWLSVFGGSAWKWNEKRGAWCLTRFHDSQMQLNWHNPAVRKEISDVARFWLEQGVDGFRLDVINFAVHDSDLRNNLLKPSAASGKKMTFDDQEHIYDINRPETPRFLEELIQGLSADYPDALFLGELAAIYGDLEIVKEYLKPGRLHTIYSDLLVYPRYPDAKTLEQLLKRVAEQLPGKELCWVLGTHDFHRVATRWRSTSFWRRWNPRAQKRMVIQSMAFLLAMKGLVSIYAGDELGLPDGTLKPTQMQDPQGINLGMENCRDLVRFSHPWTRRGPSLGFNKSGKCWLPIQRRFRKMAVDVQERNPDSVLSTTKKLIKLRREWCHGEMPPEKISSEGTMLTFERVTEEGQRFRFDFNFSANKRAQCPDSSNTQAGTVLFEQGFSAKKGTLAPYGFRITKL